MKHGPSWRMSELKGPGRSSQPLPCGGQGSGPGLSVVAGLRAGTRVPQLTPRGSAFCLGSSVLPLAPVLLVSPVDARLGFGLASDLCCPVHSSCSPSCAVSNLRVSLCKMETVALPVAQLIGASPCTLKGGGFHSQSGYMPRWRVQSWVGAHAGGNQSMFLAHIGVTLSLPLSKINFKEKISVS